VAHLEAIGGVGRRGDGSGEGARRWPAVAAAAGGDSGEGGARLANKRMPWNACELGKALGVLAGDERLRKLERWPWRAALALRARGARPLNRALSRR
jgi:hypothetical protein